MGIYSNLFSVSTHHRNLLKWRVAASRVTSFFIPRANAGPLKKYEEDPKKMMAKKPGRQKLESPSNCWQWARQTRL